MNTKHCLGSFLLAAMGIYLSFGQEPAWKWVRTTGDASMVSSASDTLGNVISVGSFMGSALNIGTISVVGSTGGEATSMYIVKYSSAGKVLWAQSVFGMESSSQVEPVKVVVNDRGETGVICKIINTAQLRVGKYSLPLANMDDKLLVLTLNKSGRFIWFRLMEPKSAKTAGIDGSDIAMDNIGNVYCTGNFSADTLLAGREQIIGNGPSILPFVAAFNPLGSLDWIRTCGFEDNGYLSQLSTRFLTLAVDGIIIGGDYQGFREYYFNGSILPRDTSLAAFVAKISYSGEFAWAKPIGGNLADFADGIATDIVGNIYLTGIYNSFLLSVDTFILTNFSGDYNLFVSKLNPDGSVVWLKDIDVQLLSYDNPGKNSYFITDAIGNMTLVTHYMGKSVLSNVFTRPNALEGTRDLLAIRLDNADGTIHWVHTGNSVSDDWLSSVAFDRFGSTYILGRLINNMVYDTISFTDAVGNGGFYIIKINYLGQLRFGRANINGADGYLAGQRILTDPFGNLYLHGNYSGLTNLLGDLPVTAPDNTGLFISKFSYTTNISGHVFNSAGTPVPSGMVKVFGYTRFQRSPLSDSTLVNTDGEYVLRDIPYGRYIIYAIPGTVSNPDAVPTYYPNASNWQDADPLLIMSSEPRAGTDIYLKEPPQPSGTATLGGLVFESDTTNVFKSTCAVQAKPVKRANVVLVGKTKAYDNVVAYTETDDDGNFSFFEISDGSYTIIVDVPGMPHNSYYDVTVTGGQLIMNLDHLVGEEDITALYGTTAIPSNRASNHDFLVYPNPGKDRLFVQNRNNYSGAIQVEIFDLSGVSVLKKSAIMSSGLNTLDISTLQKGLYLLRIRCNTLNHHEKLMVW